MHAERLVVHRGTSLFKIDSGIDDFVHDVADKIHYDNHCREENRGAHYHRVVAVYYALYKLSADSGHRENLFNNHRAADDKRKHGTEIGDDRNQRVLECVTENNL